MKIVQVVVVMAAACIILVTGSCVEALKGTYTATVMLRVSRHAPYILYPPSRQDSEREYDIYKKTQEQLLKSPFVMLAALRKPEIARLPDVQAVQKNGDPVRWLQGLVKVGFPGDAEVMTVSATTSDPQESATLVKAVVEAYLSEVVNADRIAKRQQLSELDRAYIEKETEIRGKREDLEKLANVLGNSDNELKLKLAVEELAERKGELRRIRADLRTYKRNLAAQKALLQDDAGGPDAVLTDIKQLEAFIAVTTEQESEMKAEVDRCLENVDRLNTSNVDMKMLQTDIKNLEAVLTVLASEKERSRIEIRANPRVTAPYGTTPEIPENKD